MVRGRAPGQVGLGKIGRRARGQVIGRGPETGRGVIGTTDLVVGTVRGPTTTGGQVTGHIGVIGRAPGRVGLGRTGHRARWQGIGRERIDHTPAVNPVVVTGRTGRISLGVIRKAGRAGTQNHGVNGTIGPAAGGIVRALTTASRQATGHTGMMVRVLVRAGRGRTGRHTPAANPVAVTGHTGKTDLARAQAGRGRTDPAAAGIGHAQRAGRGRMTGHIVRATVKVAANGAGAHRAGVPISVDMTAPMRAIMNARTGAKHAKAGTRRKASRMNRFSTTTTNGNCPVAYRPNYAV